MQPRTLLVLTALSVAASAAPTTSKRQLPIVGGILGGLPILGPIVGGVGGGSIGGAGGLVGGKQVGGDLPAALPEKETEDLVKRKEAIGIPDLNTDLGGLAGALGVVSGLAGIALRSEGV
jgi:hypothetical protein